MDRETAQLVGSLLLATQTGNTGLWEHAYVFDYFLAIPWEAEPGTYVGEVTYTVLQD